jgi:hypothetical protein
MVIDAAGAGMIVACPACNKDTTVPKQLEPDLPEPQPPPAPAPEKDRTVAMKWTPPPTSPGKKH